MRDCSIPHSWPFAARVAAASNALFSWAIVLACCLFTLSGCRSAQRDPLTVVFLIESSPANLDPRVGTDAQSEHIDELIFDGLVARDATFHFQPALAESWEK